MTSFDRRASLSLAIHEPMIASVAPSAFLPLPDGIGYCSAVSTRLTPASVATSSIAWHISSSGELKSVPPQRCVPSPSSLTMRPNLFHSTAGTHRLTYIMIRDRPRYQVVNWAIPLEPILALADTDGSVSSLITAPVNIVQIANLQTPTTRWMHSYDDDSEAPSTPPNEFGPGEDDSPVPSPIRRMMDREEAHGDQEVPKGEE